jgi:hypothetical protein
VTLSETAPGESPYNVAISLCVYPSESFAPIVIAVARDSGESPFHGIPVRRSVAAVDAGEASLPEPRLASGPVWRVDMI